MLPLGGKRKYSAVMEMFCIIIKWWSRGYKQLQNSLCCVLKIDALYTPPNLCYSSIRSKRGSTGKRMRMAKRRRADPLYHACNLQARWNKNISQLEFLIWGTAHRKLCVTISSILPTMVRNTIPDAQAKCYFTTYYGSLSIWELNSLRKSKLSIFICGHFVLFF